MAVKPKKDEIEVPQTRAEAEALLKVYGQLCRFRDTQESVMNARLAAVKAKAEEEAAPTKAALKMIFLQLAAWAKARRKELTDDGKTKTVEMQTGKLFWRFNPPSVQYRKGLKDDDIIAEIRAMRWTRFLRRTWEVNKEALLADPERAVQIDGVKIKEGDEKFFVEPFADELVTEQ